MNKLEAFYRDIDERVNALTHLHASRLHCNAGCCDCCIDDLTVYEVEADAIRNYHADMLEHSLPHPTGACAFLNNNDLCSIYEHRPYVCRTQGLPLHWLNENDDGTVMGFRDICPKNDDGIAVEALPEDRCWVIGPAEEKLTMMQYVQENGVMTRIRLRDMFKQQSD